MNALDAYRKSLQQLVGQSMGRDTRLPRNLVGQMRSEGFEQEILALPASVFGTQPLQDPETGELYFMVGISQVGGPDKIG